MIVENMKNMNCANVRIKYSDPTQPGSVARYAFVCMLTEASKRLGTTASGVRTNGEGWA